MRTGGGAPLALLLLERTLWKLCVKNPGESSGAWPRGPRAPQGRFVCVEGAFTGRLFSTGCGTRAGNIPDHPAPPCPGPREARGAGHGDAASRLDQALRFLVIRARLGWRVFFLLAEFLRVSLVKQCYFQVTV